MNGAELAKQILAQIPTARIVFITTYAKELAEVKDLPVFGSLLKPVDGAELEDLLDKLRARPPDRPETETKRHDP